MSNSPFKGAKSPLGTYINWDKDVLPQLKLQLRDFEVQEIKPTIRGLLYIFESQDILKKSDYRGLSRHLTEWREDGTLPQNCVVDKTRAIIDISQYIYKGDRIIVDFDEKLQTWDDLIAPEDHIRSAIDYLDNTVEDIYSHIP